ncbi:MAG: flap endonuclease-1 [Thermofilum sp.]|jgi:flap endonuclease-1|nr:flap endonuclease-1 [Thermofilum sp.]
MGTYLTPLVRPKGTELSRLKGRVLAVDTFNSVYQFLALIRDRYGRPLTNSRGKVTSHLTGLVSRYSRLAFEYNMLFIFVFDGPPHPLKRNELEKRRALREKARQEYFELLRKGDLEKAFSKAVVSASIDEWIVESSKKLLELMGFPTVQAPYDAEAQAAFLVKRGDAWAVSSMDWDSLLYGSPRLVRYVTLTGFEWLPSRMIARRLKPEIIELEDLLRVLKISLPQLVDLAILIGTDYNEGVYGLGPKRALSLIRKYGSLERLPLNLRRMLPDNYEEIRELFLNPPVTTNYSVEFGRINEEGLREFLVDENNFSPEKVETYIKRLRSAFHRRFQSTLSAYL